MATAEQDGIEVKQCSTKRTSMISSLSPVCSPLRSYVLIFHIPIPLSVTKDNTFLNILNRLPSLTYRQLATALKTKRI